MRALIAKEEHRHRARAAVRADDDAERRDRDLADLGICLADLVAHPLGIGDAVRLQDVDLRAGRIALAEIVQDAVANGAQRRLAPAHLLRHVERTGVRDIEHGLNVKDRADERGAVRDAPALFEIIEIVHGEAVGDAELVLLAPGDDLIEACPGFLAADHVHHEQTQTAASETTAPTAAPAPQTTPTQGLQEPEKARWTLPLWVPLTLAALALAGLAAEGQRLVRIELRRRHQRRGNNNQRAAACAQEIQLLSRLTRVRVPEELTQLTEKAVFSQHTLTPEELRAYALCQAACRRRLRQAPWWKKPLYRYWYAVI